MLKPRTDDEILSRSPLKVTFNNKQYEIKILTILKARAWREKYVQTMHEMAQSLNVQLPDGAVGADLISEALSASLTATMLRSPEKIVELIFAYAPDLPKEEILENATEEEVRIAYSQIMQVAMPFLVELGAMLKMANTTLELQQ